MTKYEELLMSHYELLQVCKALMQLALENDFLPQLDEKLAESGIQPGFAQRADAVEEKYKRERRMLIADGRIN